MKICAGVTVFILKKKLPIDMQTNFSLVTFTNANEVAEAGLQLLLQAANEAITQHGRFVLALAGGTTPKKLYQLLANTQQDWEKWFLIYGDERYLPETDNTRNSFMVYENWLSKVNFPVGNHFILNTASDVDTAAKNYAQQIEHLLPIDLALLGMGEDGHTASLFPQNLHKQLQSSASVLAVHNAPKPPSARISLSYQTLNQANIICFLVTGNTKQQAIQQWLQGVDLPVSNISGIKKTYCLTDII